MSKRRTDTELKRLEREAMTLLSVMTQLLRTTIVGGPYEITTLRKLIGERRLELAQVSSDELCEVWTAALEPFEEGSDEAAWIPIAEAATLLASEEEARARGLIDRAKRDQILASR